MQNPFGIHSQVIQNRKHMAASITPLQIATPKCLCTATMRRSLTPMANKEIGDRTQLPKKEFLTNNHKNP